MKKPEEKYGPLFRFPDNEIAQGKLGTGTAKLNQGLFKPGKVLYEFDNFPSEMVDKISKNQKNEINRQKFEARKKAK
jgi:hypothetical protein